MNIKRNQSRTQHFYKSFEDVKRMFYDKCNFEITNLFFKTEGNEYGACSYNLNGKLIEGRFSKITPKKSGQFVTLWKRNIKGKTAPFDISDELDFIVIFSQCENNSGHFVFPKSVLIEKRIFSSNEIMGKMGIRVYPPWDETLSNQARKTQNWQLDYFIRFKESGSTNLKSAKMLYFNK